MLLTKVKETIKKYSMLDPGTKVLVAVSGGPDSVCMLAALYALSAELGCTIHIAHLDHMFRGKESADEALFVAGLAKKFGLPATVEKFDVPAFCRDRGLSSQEGARAVRYEFLDRVARETGALRIATGHTADDQAETILMRLIRGAGVSGLSAIPPMRENIIRPLIAVTRDEVLEHLRSKDLPFMSDPSNTKPLYTRNRVRSEIIPLLKQFNPRIIETLAAEAALLRDEDEAVESHLGSIANTMITEKEDNVFAKRDEFNSLPPAFRRRLFRKMIGLIGMGSSLPSLDQISDALAFMAAAQTGRTMRLPRDLTILREYNQLVISTHAVAEGFSYALPVPGTLAIPELGMEIETLFTDGLLRETDDKNYFWQAMFDYDKMGPHLKVRSRHPGDWFCPAGMGGKHKKLQDYFVDEKVPRRKRDTIPLLSSGEDLLWVVGLRTDERFLPAENTKKILLVRVRNAE